MAVGDNVDFKVGFDIRKEKEDKEKDNDKLLEKTKQITKCVKIRLIVFVSVSMVLIIFFWYYITFNFHL